MEVGDKQEYRILEPQDPLLRKVTTLVSDFKSAEFKNGLRAMQEVAGVIQDPKPGTKTMVGLAAPQTGWDSRVILVDSNADPKAVNPTPNNIFMINPVIIYSSDKQIENRESCFSLPGYGGVVARSKQIRVRWQDESGKEKSGEFEGFIARVIQHEIDHLNGIRWFQRVLNPAYLHKVPDEDFQRYREQWHNWDMLADRNEIETLVTQDQN